MNRKGFLHFVCLCLAFLLLCFAIGGLLVMDWVSEEDLRFVAKLGAGWNLGNTLEPYDLHFETDDPADYETYWNNPITTKEIFADVRQAGFSVLRIPVTWQDHMDDNFQVDSAWMDRVQQVVDDGLSAGFYVIINAHHDKWYYPDEANYSRAEAITRSLWAQIARRFAGYPDRLMFESMNEPRLVGTSEEWSAGTPESREVVNKLNAVFVETVREVEGKGENRYLLLPTFCARTDAAAMEDFRLPQGKRLIASVHLYAPYRFAQDKNGTDVFSPDDEANTERIDQAFANIKRFFIDKNIPVIITEFGAIDKDNERQRVEWAKYVLQIARSLGVPCVWWDAGGKKKEDVSFSLYDRYAMEWRFPHLVQTLVEYHRN